MHCFIAAEDLHITTRRYTRSYKATELTSEMKAEGLIIDVGGESENVRKTIVGRRDAGSEVSETLPSPITYLNEEAVHRWDAMPPRLGRVSIKLLSDKLQQHNEPDTLKAQLSVLRSRKPNQNHYRLAVVSAFGTNLGDCLIGMSAMRSVTKIIEAYLPSFSIDFLMGTDTNPTNIDIVSHAPWVGFNMVTSPTLLEFAKYDAYFDFTGLLALPKFTEMVINDWYLWWSGLDHETIDPLAKRNILNMRYTDWQAVNQHIGKIAGQKILFNAFASVPLRSMPPKRAERLLLKLLDALPDAQFIIDRPMNVEDARVHNLSQHINSPGKFGALCAQMDAVISVDTFALHVADAASVPTIGMFSTLEPAAYCYYPHMSGVVIPDAKHLPAWGKVKISNEDWEKWQPQYDKAWGKLRAIDVAKALKPLIEARSSKAPHAGLNFIHSDYTPTLYRRRDGHHELVNDQQDPSWLRAERRIMDVVDTLVNPGTTNVLVTPGRSHLPMKLTQKMRHGGELHIYEPRIERAGLIQVDLLENNYGTVVHNHDTLPIEAERLESPIEEALNATNPAYWSKNRVRRVLQPSPVDSLNLEKCHNILMLQPADFLQVLTAARMTLERDHPNIVCAPFFGVDVLREVAKFLHGLKYQCWADRIEGGSSDVFMMLAFPEHITVNASGMQRIEIKG
jgi:hypothetical protein